MTQTSSEAAGRRSGRAREPDAEGWAVRDGIKLAWSRYGSGEPGRPTVLLMPTWSIVDSRVWRAQIGYLARHFDVITFDGRGCGRSSSRAGGGAVAADARRRRRRSRADDRLQRGDARAAGPAPAAARSVDLRRPTRRHRGRRVRSRTAGDPWLDRDQLRLRRVRHRRRPTDDRGPCPPPGRVRLPTARADLPGLGRRLRGGGVAAPPGAGCRAAARPFLYVPLRHHFEQNFHVRARLERYRAGVCLDYARASDPDALATALLGVLDAPVVSLPVESDGASRAAGLLADLL